MTRTFFIDKDKCIGCYTCTVACKLEHNLPPHPTKPPLAEPKGPELIRVYEVSPEMHGGEFYQYWPVSCMHCDDAPCIEVCPDSAIYKDSETGTILVDEDKCTGCKACLSVCPFGAPQFYEKKLKLCDLCLQRFKEGRQTACEAACPARAIHVGSPDEISALIGKKAAERGGKAIELSKEGS